MFNKVALAAVAATLALALRAPNAEAQKALVYCPVGIDAAGCDRVVASLQNRFPEGVDRGYDGTSGTVDLKKADLQHFGVFVVPSLADAGGKAPYALLRQVAPRLKMSITGRVAVYSGAPDQGTGNRADKDLLVQNLAKWAADGHTRKTGLVGLVALLDLSENVASRYSWVRDISAADVSADAEVQAFSEVTPVTDHGRSVLSPSGKPMAYANMASYGLHIGSRAAARTLVAAVAGSDSHQSVLVMFTTDDKHPNNGNGNGASNNVSSTTKSTFGSDASRTISASGASASMSSSVAGDPTITTDKPDYLPGDTVTFSGTGWAPGDTVVITVHEDPTWSFPDRQFTAIANGAGEFTNRDMIVDVQDFGATFTATAVANPSGLVAQMTFTDGRSVNTATLNGASSVSVLPGATISAQVNVTTDNGGGNNNWKSTSWVIGTGASTCVNHGDHNSSGTANETFNITAPLTAGTYNVTFVAYQDDACSTGASGAFALTNGVTVNVGALASFKVTNTSGGLIGAQTAGTAFDIKVTAVDVGGNTVTSFNGSNNKVTISSTGTLSVGSGVTAAFTNGVLSPLSVNFSNTGTFTITATRFNGGTESGTSNSFTVAAPACTAPSITTQPTNQTPTAFTAASFSVAASGTATLTYQWRKGGANITTATNPTANSATLNIPSATSADAGSYDVVVTNGCGVTTSNAATLTITKVTPAFTNLTAPQTITYGAASVAVGGTIASGTNIPSGNVAVTLNGVTQQAAINSSTGAFTTTFTTTTLPASATAYAVTYSFTADNNFNSASDNTTTTVTVNKATTSVGSITASASTYGGTTDASATVTPATAGSVAFYINGSATPVPATTYDATTGVASLTGYAHGLNASATAYSVRAVFTSSNTNFDGSDATNASALTVGTKTITITPTSGLTKVYGGADPALTYAPTPALLGTDTFSGTLSRASGETVGAYAIGLGTLSAGSNYTLVLSATPVTFSITAKAVTVTFTASDKEYDGTNTASVSACAIATGKVGTDDITCSVANGTFASTNASTSAQVVSATATLSGAAAGNYSVTNPVTSSAKINAKPVTVTFSAADKEYDGTNAATVSACAIATGKVGSDDVTCSVASGTFASANASSSAQTVSATATLGGTAAGNYTVTNPVTSSAKISPKAITVTPTSGQSKVYGASDPTLAYTPSPSLLGGDSFTGALSRAPGENVGTYAIELGTLAAGPNYNVTLSSTPVTFEITPKSVTITPTAGQSKVYGASDPTLAFTPSPSLSGGASFSGHLDRAPGENVGTYAITLGTLSAGSNYTLHLDPTPVTFAITAKAVTVTFSAADKVYDGTNTASVSSCAIATGKVGTDDVTCSVASGTFASTSASPNPQVVSATATLGGAAAGNYSVVNPVTSSARITPKAVTVTFSAADKEYDGTNTASVSSCAIATGKVGSDDVTCSVSGGTFASANADPNAQTVSATATLGGGAAGNYSVTNPVTSSAKITPKPITITPTSGQSKVYGTSDPTLTYTPSPTLLAGGSFTGALSRDPGNTVGVYAITLGTLSAGGNYALSLGGSVTFEITRKEVTVSFTATDKVYDGDNVAAVSGCTIATGKVSGDDLTCSVAGGTFASINASSSAQTVSATATLAGSTAGNYSVTNPVTSSAKITPRPVTVTFTAADKEYDGTNTASVSSCAIATGKVGSDDVTCSVANGTFASANASSSAQTVSATATLGGAAAGNYGVTNPVTTTAKINPKPITIAPTAGQSKVYGEADPVLAYTPSPSLLNSDGFSGALARAPGSNVGTYAINLGTLSAGTNYSLTLSSTPVTFEITQKPITITPTAGQSKVYGDNDPTLTYTPSPALLGGDTFSGALGRAAGNTVGLYAIGLGTLSAGGNYLLSLSATTVNFEITPRPATWTTNAASKTYGAADPNPLTTGSGTFLLADNVTATYSRAAGETVAGSPYHITANLSAAAGVLANYIITNTGADFTINPKALTVKADDKHRVFGEANPTFTATISGYANGENFATAGVTGSPSFSGAGPTSTGTTSPGGYAIVPAKGSLAAPNYTFETGAGAVFTSGTLTIDKANTTTSVASDINPSVFGQTVTFTATVAAVAPGAGTPTGTVQFTIDGSPVGSPVSLASGQATYATSLLTVATHTVSATYGGSTDFNGHTGSLSGGQKVNQASTTTSVTSSANPSTFGNSVTFTATVAAVAPGAGTPGGTVQFEIDGVNAGSPVSLSGGQATYSTSALTVAGSPHTIKAYYSGSTSFISSNGTLTGGQTVGKVGTTTTVTVDQSSAQYSDAVTFTAVISPASVNSLNPATTATFKVGTQTMGTATFALVGGQWKATLANQKLLETVAGQMAPGVKTVTAVISGIDPNFTVSDGTTTFNLTTEDARVAYSGLMYVSTPSASATSADVTLRATITDITGMSADAAYDPDAGDIRNARVKFINLDGGAVLGSCTDLTPVLLDGANTKVGTVSCTVNLSAVSGNEPSVTYRVGTVVSRYYGDDSDIDDANEVDVTVTVGGTGFISGGGYLVSSLSSGTYASTPGSKTNFGYNVKFNKSGTNLQGHVNVIIRQKVGNAWKIYQIKSNSISSLSQNQTTSGGTALFASKANLTDITNPLNPVSLGGNMALEMQLTDVGEPGTGDLIGFTLWSGNIGTSSLLFSSNWTGGKTIQQLLGGGNLQVR